MHSFTKLIDICVAYTVGTLNEVNKKTIDALQNSAATVLVKTLQMIELQKVIFAVGMVSIFESELQTALECNNGFDKARKILDAEGEIDITERFDNLIMAINVLKHGRGRSYDALVLKADTLPFKVLQPNESFFEEGDVSEVSTFVKVDDEFIQYCSDVIFEVVTVIKRVNPVFL